jgi:serine/threonine protein kinase
MVGQTISHYRVVEKLGAGGMGVVYKAQDMHLGRSVAIKVLPPEKVADPERKRRFVQEAKACRPQKLHPRLMPQRSSLPFWRRSAAAPHSSLRFSLYVINLASCVARWSGRN